MATIVSESSRADVLAQTSKTRSGVFPIAQSLASVGAALLGLAAVAAATRESAHGSAATIMVALSSAAVGALIGFLFGVPPATGDSDRSRNSSDSARDTNAAAAGGPVDRIVQNTSLQEISSWLTKIIVGAGLVNLHGLASWIRDIGLAIAKQVNLPGFGEIFGSAVVVYFFVVGFISAYTYTRTRVASLFAQSDRSILALFEQQLIAARTKTVDEVSARTQSVVDGKLQELVEQQESMRRVVETNTQAALESRMLTALYSPPPQGYELTIQLAEESERNETLTPKGWYYLACAYGQQAAHAELNEAEREQVANKALRAFEHLRTDETIRKLALKLYRGELGQGENDFAAFGADPRFEALLREG